MIRTDHDPTREDTLAPPSPRRRLQPSRMVKVLPSVFTLGNLLCGFAAIFYASRPEGAVMPFGGAWSNLTLAASLIVLGMLFDALDGRVARLTNQTSELGEQLDSMADMVAFGIAPAFLVIQLVNIGTPFFGPEIADTYFDRAVLVIAGVYAACTALRLARFNTEIEDPENADHMSFKGLPSPAAAGTIVSLILLHQDQLAGNHPQWARLTAVGMVFITLLVAIAMVSNMRYAHIANRYIRSSVPFHIAATAVIAVLIPLLIFPQPTLAIAACSYALYTPIRLTLRTFRRKLNHNGASTN
ncbi:MAG: CDP-diacylglycerol--serine O-phosphatidyltransferase [Planctomycetota bacterium]|jgi:CDP-diacylglycerol--serine O-phosphatidyltransferase